MTPPGWTVRRAALVAAGVGMLVHAGALWNGFAYDDWVLVAGDPGIRSFDGLGARLLEPSWPGAFGEEVGGWRPVTTFTWAVTWIVSGGSPAAFHAMGIFFHGLTTALLTLVASSFLPLFGALAAGLVFAVHPVHVEAVANVVGSAESIAAVFALLATWVWLRAGRTFGVGRIVAVSGLYGLAVLGKEGAAVLPLLLFFTDAARADDSARRSWAWMRARLPAYAALSVVLAGLLVARSAVLGGVTQASHPPGASVLQEIPRIWTIAGAWPHYFRLFFFPLELAADYGPGVIRVAYGWTVQGIVGVVLVLGTLVGVGLAWRRSEPLGWARGEEDPGSRERGLVRVGALGLLWAGAALLPVANVAYLGPVFVAERTLYLSSVGIGILVGACLSAPEARGRAALAGLAALVVAGGIRTATRVPDWRSTDTIMEALIDDRPESGRGWLALGQRWLRENRPVEARRAFAIAIGLLNSEYKESTEIASYLMSMGRAPSARLLLERAWREEPSWPTAPGLLASVELAAGRHEAAARAARAAAEAQPDNGSFHHLLAQALSAAGRPAEAIPSRRRAIAEGLGDAFRPWFLLAGDQASLGDTVAALAALDSASVRARTEDENEAVGQFRLQLGLPSNPNELR